MSDRVASQDAEANAEVSVGRFRSSARGLARTMRSVPGSVVLSFIILIAVAVCVFFSPLIVPNALGQDVSLGESPAGTPGHIFGTDKVGRDILALTIAGALRCHRSLGNRWRFDDPGTDFWNDCRLVGRLVGFSCISFLRNPAFNAGYFAGNCRCRRDRWFLLGDGRRADHFVCAF